VVPFSAGEFWFVWLLVVAINVVIWGGPIVLIALGIRWLIRQNASDRYRPPEVQEDTALQLLRQRYARGEIDAAEFEEKRRTLGG